LQVGEALNRPEAGRHLKANFIDRLNALCKQSKPHHKRILFLEWLSPLMTAGHWTPELIEFAGGTPLQSEAGKSFRVLSETDFGKLQPEIIVVAPCGFSVSKTLQERESLDAICREWRAPIYIVDGNHFFNRSGPRLVESAEILHAIIHEKQIPHGDTVLYRG
jgi:iron complex transport system substrate-binding protein